jgi:HSP20 family molecular chaperone IbpA
MKAIHMTCAIALAFGFSLTCLGEEPITGEALERASAAALEYTGGGEVTDTEVGDEEGYYEVEVTLPGGRQVDVHLDASFKVIDSEGDGNGEQEDEDDGAGSEDDDE